MTPALMDNLSRVDKNLAFLLLTKIANLGIDIHLKGKDSQQIFKSKLTRNPARKIFYISNTSIDFDLDTELTFKLIVDNKLFFLKTIIKKSTTQFYFEAFDGLFELIRRKKPRFPIPESWAQSAKIQALNAPSDLKAPADILDLSRAGIRLVVKPLLPKFEINQKVNLYFKIYRRAEIMIQSKIIYLKKNVEGGPTIGLEFIDSSILTGNKIQNVCDDLAFYYTSEASL